MNKYIITGKTFSVKEELKECGCRWEPKIKAWVTKLIEHGGHSHLLITSICNSAGLRMEKVAATENAQKIQSILLKGQK